LLYFSGFFGKLFYCSAVVFYLGKHYNNCMDIQSLSVNMSQEKVQEQASVQVQAMGLNMMKEQAVALEKLLSTVQFVNDPNLGRNINLLA